MFGGTNLSIVSIDNLIPKNYKVSFSLRCGAGKYSRKCLKSGQPRSISNSITGSSPKMIILSKKTLTKKQARLLIIAIHKVFSRIFS